MYQSKKEEGFTLIELLIVIAIIGILASVILSSLNTARDKAKTAKVTAEIRNIRSAITQLEDDTGKWPNGCPVSTVQAGSGNEVSLTDPEAGIIAAPTAGTHGGCTWTDDEVAAWKGPYMPSALDSWGTPYWFDSDYFPRKDCGNPTVSAIVAIESHGPNKVGGAENTVYDCDDIYVEVL